MTESPNRPREEVGLAGWKAHGKTCVSHVCYRRTTHLHVRRISLSDQNKFRVTVRDATGIEFTLSMRWTSGARRQLVLVFSSVRVFLRLLSISVFLHCRIESNVG